MLDDDVWLIAGAVLGAVIAAAIPLAMMLIARLVGAPPRNNPDDAGPPQ